MAAKPELESGMLAEGLRGLLGRRSVLRGAALTASGIAAAALLGCGGDDEEDGDGGGGGEATATGTPAARKWPGVTISDGRFFGFNFDDATTTPKTGGRLRFLFTFDPQTLDPRKTQAGGSHTAINASHNRLIGVYGGPDADPFEVNKLQPELAKSWETSPDGLTYTFHLEQGVKWQNIAPVSGREFKASDVVYAYDQYKSGGAQTALFTTVDRFEAKDDYTFVVRMKQPTPDFILGMSTAHPSVFAKELADSGDIERKAIGTGPMIVKEWQSGKGGTFDRNPDYFKQATLIDGMDLPYIADVAARTAAYRAEQVDYGHSTTSVTELDAILRTNPGTTVFTSPIFASTFSISMNMSSPKYADERLRRAISLAVDRGTLERLIYGDLGKSMPTMDWRFAGFTEEPSAEQGAFGKWWRYDPTESKALLQAAGVQDFTINMVFYNYGDDSNSRPNDILVDQLRQVGINLVPQRLEYTQFNSQWTTRQVEDAADGWLTHGASGEHVVYGLNHSKSSANRWRINDPQIDTWADQHRSELNPQTRAELARKVWDRVMDQVYRVEKPSGYGFLLQQPWVRGVRYSRPIGSGQYYLDLSELVSHAWLDK
ncbi:MAG: ABC transporter substrate-binding protein [Dehalococcoidia bacterium]